MTEMFSLAEATMKVILDRRSIREFTDEPVSEEDLQAILEAARQAPSGENAQPWRFVIIKDPDMRQAIATIAGGGSGRRFTAEFVTKKMQARFSSLQDEAKKKAAFEKLTSGQVSAFVGDAPIIIMVCGKKDVWDMPYDTSAAIENMLLMITALGLGACWVIAPCIDVRDEERMQQLLGVPAGYKVVSAISLGYPTRPHRPRPRIPLHELVYSEQWGAPYYEAKQ
ncbi:MAG TPA: nitroreductase family protein [Anaerolineae bacterium]|nr:nitroreductase family protein [Anaerolineae bacterium]HOR01514.1 nitroreductase family protein [Anaerolineae bacterium]HPL29040.1 nitroreductase family protein [Anaerolineae bacterium]